MKCEVKPTKAFAHNIIFYFFSFFYLFFYQVINKQWLIKDSSPPGRVKIETNRLICLAGKVFANGPGNLGSIPDRVIPKTLKMVLDTTLLNTQQYKGRIKGKVE